MSEITLTDKQWAALPYKNTTVSRGKTLGEITGMLEDHDIHDYQWTKFQGQDMLSFPLTIKRRDVELGFVVKLTVPRIHYNIKKGKGKYAPRTLTYLENISWRIFWWYLKAKLEAIEYGISDEVKEFMYNITYSLPDARTGQTVDIKMGEVLLDNLEQLGKLALTDQSKRKTIDAEE